MNKLKFVMAAGLLAATAACTQTGPDNSYGYNGGYNTRPAYTNAYNANPNPYNAGYNRSGTYYNNTAYNTNRGPYAARPANPRGPNGDYDRDGVPNRRDVDANGDHIPDAFQR